jgi:hypothetical protein
MPTNAPRTTSHAVPPSLQLPPILYFLLPYAHRLPAPNPQPTPYDTLLQVRTHHRTPQHHHALVQRRQLLLLQAKPAPQSAARRVSRMQSVHCRRAARLAGKEDAGGVAGGSQGEWREVDAVCENGVREAIREWTTMVDLWGSGV